MKLVPADDDSKGLGLWTDPHWNPGTPATFAVIIGVSRYRHLKDGEEPTDSQGRTWIAEAKDLGQLHVSALTAFRMFCWLAGQYRHEAPLARCWLLLAPKAQEEPLLILPDSSAVRWGEPSLANCNAAIRWWSSTMRSLPRAVASGSRGLFFFSGHGLESTQERQLLLPCDYLAPPEPNINAAISTSNLRYGLGSLKVNQQLFFVDACRNDHKELRGKEMVGTKILVEEDTSTLPPELLTPVLYSTGPGQRSWEYRDPSKGISIYGQALLDGLCGKPNIEIKGAGQQCRIELSPLEQYVRARVLQLLEAAKSKERQFVRLGGQSDTSMTITYVDPPAPAAAPTAAGPKVVAREHEIVVPAAEFDAVRNSLEQDRATTIRGIHFRSDGMVKFELYTKAADLPQPLDQTFPARVPLPASEALAAETPIRELSATRKFSPRWLEDWSEGHRLFGSETVTALWQERTKVWLLGKRKWRGAQAIRIAEVARDEDRGRYRVRLQIAEKEDVGYWLQMTDEEGTVHACMLPRDVPINPADARDPVYELSIDRSPSDGVRRIIRLEGYLGDQSGSLSYAATLWRRYTTEHVAAAVQESEAKELRTVIENKIKSPLAATIAALVLLRANRLDRLPQRWLRNLANWFPRLPDGAVLFAERRLREKQTTKKGAKLALQEAAAHLLMVRDRGIPRTSEVFDYAVSLVGRLKDAKELGARVREGLNELDNYLDNAFALYRTGGLFSSFSGLSADLDPDRLWRDGSTPDGEGRDH
jgi:hypothetical protein